MNISKLVVYLLATVLWSNVSIGSEKYLDAEGLAQELRSKNIDRIVQSMNSVKQMSYRGEVLPLIQDLWERREEKYPDLPWKLIQSDRVRVEIADVLVQARLNGLVDVNLEPIHTYVTGLINGNDVDVVRVAISVLSQFDDPADVDKITGVAKKGNPWLFRTCVVALADMCNSSAERGLDDIERNVADVDLKKFLSETRKQMSDFKKKTNRCASTKSAPK